MKERLDEKNDIDRTERPGRSRVPAPAWGALWFSDLAHGTVHRWDGTGEPETVIEVPGRAGGLGWLPDGRLLVVSMDGGRVHCLEADGELVVHADLRHVVGGPVNDMLVDPEGRAYVGNFGFDYHAPSREHPNSMLYAPPGPPGAPLACLAPDGSLLGLTSPCSSRTGPCSPRTAGA
ncbi:SMP-30/gluconolactonase/LRE family protein [Streptomyces sp. NPDC050549]|uniref:SMP-30/gluconolactonase/LRE family protein n=1 Tax=Streptomyces sp. NPDC050549 TaxID=3155406 RepID=UPI0034329DC7